MRHLIISTIIALILSIIILFISPPHVNGIAAWIGAILALPIFVFISNMISLLILKIQVSDK